MKLAIFGVRRSFLGNQLEGWAHPEDLSESTKLFDFTVSDVSLRERRLKAREELTHSVSASTLRQASLAQLSELRSQLHSLEGRGQLGNCTTCTSADQDSCDEVLGLRCDARELDHHAGEEEQDARNQDWPADVFVKLTLWGPALGAVVHNMKSN
jgi:hypothetical protein